MKEPFLGKIPIDPQVVESGDAGVPIALSHPNNEGAKVFYEAALKIENSFISEKQEKGKEYQPPVLR